MPKLSNKVYLIALGLVLALAASCRLWAAPISAGPDMAQFWAFAKVFQFAGLDFYQYAEATLPIFPYKYWAFFYPPIWLLILVLALMAAPTSSASAYMVDSSWRLAMKTPLILADLAIGGLLYWAVPGSKIRKLIFASLWLFLPTAWYESAVFGQFDAVAAAFLLASIILLERGRDRLAFLFAGLAVMTKQHSLIPIALMVVIAARNMSWRRLVTNCAITAGVCLFFSIPFLITGNFSAYASSIFLPARMDYQLPLYSFSGIGAALTYLRSVFGWETIGLFPFTFPIMGLALIAVMVASYRRVITPAQGALVGFLLFISLSFRVNYQFLIIYIPIALLVASRTQYISERAFTIALALLPSVWLWLFDVSIWFTRYAPVDPRAAPILARIGLTHQTLPDYAYVFFALALMYLALAYVVYTFWGKERNSPEFLLPLGSGEKGRD